jgi:predicted RNA-binding Zn-ribbon protein involved in translation (DUF1610 family)
MNENREHCKAIAERLEAVAEGTVYRCPECGEWITFDNEQYDDENASYTCQECGATFDECDLEAVSFYDYFEGGVYDVEFRVGSDREYRSVKIMVACGGPNIFIDTAAGAVMLYWWTDRAEYPLDPDTIAAVNEWAEEWFNC